MNEEEESDTPKCFVCGDELERDECPACEGMGGWKREDFNPSDCREWIECEDCEGSGNPWKCWRCGALRNNID